MVLPAHQVGSPALSGFVGRHRTHHTQPTEEDENTQQAVCLDSHESRLSRSFQSRCSLCQVIRDGRLGERVEEQQEALVGLGVLQWGRVPWIARLQHSVLACSRTAGGLNSHEIKKRKACNIFPVHCVEIVSVLVRRL